MNDSIIIKYSDKNTDASIIYDLMGIEKDVYKDEDRGEYDNIERRFVRNKEMFILLYDNDKLIGYLCYFPISKDLHDRVMSADDFYDDNIEAKDVVGFSNENYIYLISIALYKKYQERGLGKIMMDAFFKKLREKDKAGFKIKDVLGSTISDQGDRILKKYGFRLVKDMKKEYGYKLMYLEGEKIW